MNESRIVIEERSLRELAEVLREKSGTTQPMDIDEMVAVADTIGMPELEELTTTENGEYKPTTYGFSKVTVDVQPEREEISITENGEYIPDTYGFSKVEVDVQPTLEELSVDKNGEYTPTEYGYSKVIVNCPPPPPEEFFEFTGDLSYRFKGWGWFVDLYGDKITTKDVTNLSECFRDFSEKEIPFIINIKKCSTFTNMFSSSKVEVCPKIRGELDTSRMPLWVNSISANYIRDLNDLFEPEMLDYVENLKITSAYSAQYAPNFNNCWSLRTVPDWWYKLKLNKDVTVAITSSALYNACFSYCYSLDEALNIPVWTCTKPFTSNLCNNTFSNTHRLKNITFETDNGQPIVVSWKSQTIDLSAKVSVGYTPDTSYATVNFNSGITIDKRVTDDASYQALKNDPDWWTNKIEYSRYNHDSAVETINSLPDASAYLASAGGTNTIKFASNSGSATDGGAIGNLTAEEIAVATAKGWTVTFA
jgi:hypothetical protein